MNRDQEKAMFARHARATQKRREIAQKKFDEKVVGKYGSMENYINSVLEKDQKILSAIKETKSNALVAKANRNKAITGNPYYTQSTLQGKDSIHCADCGQRLGGITYPCPLCNKHGYVYGKMLNNPADERWNDPMYNKDKFLRTYQTVGGIVHETTAEETALKERMKNFGNTDELK